MLDLKRFSRIPFLAVGLWLLAHVLFLIVLFDHHDSKPAILNFSLAYAELLIVVALAAVGGAIFAILRNMIRLPELVTQVRTNSLFRAIMLCAGTGVLLYVWLTPISGIFLTTLQKELIRGWITILVLAVTYAGLFWRADDIAIPWALWLVVGAAFAIGAMVIGIHYLDRFPQLNTIDELHNWSVQWTYANTGLLGEAMYRQMIPLPQPIYDSPHYIAGLLLRIVGDEFWQARFIRLLLTCLALPFIYLSGKRLYGKRAGLCAVVVAIFLIIPVDYVRPDFFVGIMLSVAIYVYLRAQTTRRPWMHYLTGLCVAVAGEGHPLAYRFGLVFAMLYTIRWVYEMWQTRRFFIDGRLIALALGGFTGMMIYLSIHILPNLDQGLHFIKGNTPAATSPTGKTQFDYAGEMIDQQFSVWVFTSPFELVFVVLGFVLALYKFEDGDRLLLALLVVSEGLMLATYGYYRQFYQVHFLPVFALLAGRFLANFTDNRQRSRTSAGQFGRLALVGMVFIVSLFIMVQDAQASVPDPMREEFTTIANMLKKSLPPDKVVVGNEDYFLELHSLNYYGIETVTSDKWFKVNYQGYELWQVTKPDIFIISPEIDEPQYTDIASINRYMADNHFTLVACYTHSGLIHAYVYVRDTTGWKLDPYCVSANDQ